MRRFKNKKSGREVTQEEKKLKNEQADLSKKQKRREQMRQIRSLIAINRDNRKKVQEITRNIEPALGKVTQTYHNVLDTLDNYMDSRENGLNRMLLAEDVDDLEMADHLFVQRPGLTHHGLYVENGIVLHYKMGRVMLTTLELFAQGSKIQKKTDEDSKLSYARQEALKRGFSRYGENKYNLVFNNCEHFVRWCRNGPNAEDTQASMD